jgi:hypothetical protein
MWGKVGWLRPQFLGISDKLASVYGHPPARSHPRPGSSEATELQPRDFDEFLQDPAIGEECQLSVDLSIR